MDRLRCCNGSRYLLNLFFYFVQKAKINVDLCLGATGQHIALHYFVPGLDYRVKLIVGLVVEFSLRETCFVAHPFEEFL